jgi:hypothetical protein
MTVSRHAFKHIKQTGIRRGYFLPGFFVLSVFGRMVSLTVVSGFRFAVSSEVICPVMELRYSVRFLVIVFFSFDWLNTTPCYEHNILLSNQYFSTRSCGFYPQDAPAYYR